MNFNIFNLISSNFGKIVKFITLIISIIILLNTMFISGVAADSQNITLSMLTIFSLLAVIIVFLFSVIHFIDNNKNYRKWVIGFTLILEFVFQIIAAFNMQGAQASDDINIYIQAGNLAKNIHTLWLSYFDWAPQNVGATVIYSIIIKFCNLININASLGLTIFSLFCADFAAIVGFKILKLITDNNQKLQDIYIIVMCMFIPYIAISFIVYTDILALLFVVCGIYYFIKYDKSDFYKLRGINIALSGVFFGISIAVKQNSLVILIAVLLYSTFHNISKNWKYIIIFLMIIFSILGSNSRYAQSKTNSDGNFPYTYWLGLGINDETNGMYGKTVNGNFVDPWQKTAQFKTKEEKNEYNINYIKSQIKKLGPIGILNLWERKTNVMWSTGNEGSYRRGYEIASKVGFPYEYIYGINRTAYLTFSQSIYVLIILGLVIYLISSKENSKYNSLISLSFLGIYFFHILLWEVQERYAYLAIIFIVILSVQGIEILFERIEDNIQRASKKNVLKVFLIILIIVMTSMIFEHDKVYNIRENDKLVSSQLFVNNKIKLKKGGNLKEKIYSPDSFDKVKTNFIENDGKDIEVKLTAISGKNKKIIKLNPNGITEVKGSKGNYFIEVKNISNKTVDILTTESKGKIGILQNNSIKNVKDNYFQYRLMKKEYIGDIGKTEYYILYGMTIVLLLLSYVYIIKYTT